MRGERGGDGRGVEMGGRGNRKTVTITKMVQCCL